MKACSTIQTITVLMQLWIYCTTQTIVRRAARFPVLYLQFVASLICLNLIFVSCNTRGEFCSSIVFAETFEYDQSHQYIVHITRESICNCTCFCSTFSSTIFWLALILVPRCWWDKWRSVYSASCIPLVSFVHCHFSQSPVLPLAYE